MEKKSGTKMEKNKTATLRLINQFSSQDVTLEVMQCPLLHLQVLNCLSKRSAVKTKYINKNTKKQDTKRNLQLNRNF